MVETEALFGPAFSASGDQRYLRRPDHVQRLLFAKIEGKRFYPRSNASAVSIVTLVGR